jgi:hypothetical protein
VPPPPSHSSPRNVPPLVEVPQASHGPVDVSPTAPSAISSGHSAEEDFDEFEEKLREEAYQLERSDFSIFTHDLKTQIAGIYADVKGQLPSVQIGDDADDADDDVVLTPYTDPLATLKDLRKSRKLTDCHELLSSLLAQRPNDPRLLRQAAKLHLLDGEHALAEAALTRAIESSGVRNVKNFLLRGNIRLKMGRYRAAAEDLELVMADFEERERAGQVGEGEFRKAHLARSYLRNARSLAHTEEPQIGGGDASAEAQVERMFFASVAAGRQQREGGGVEKGEGVVTLVSAVRDDELDALISSLGADDEMGAHPSISPRSRQDSLQVRAAGGGGGLKFVSSEEESGSEDSDHDAPPRSSVPPTPAMPRGRRVGEDDSEGGSEEETGGASSSEEEWDDLRSRVKAGLVSAKSPPSADEERAKVALRIERDAAIARRKGGGASARELALAEAQRLREADERARAEKQARSEEAKRAEEEGKRKAAEAKRAAEEREAAKKLAAEEAARARAAEEATRAQRRREDEAKRKEAKRIEEERRVEEARIAAEAEAARKEREALKRAEEEAAASEAARVLAEGSPSPPSPFFSLGSPSGSTSPPP